MIVTKEIYITNDRNYQDFLDSFNIPYEEWYNDFEICYKIDVKSLGKDNKDKLKDLFNVDLNWVDYINLV